MAKSWLAETDMAVKDIAEKLKYKNSQNFIRSFKKLEGITPGNYRQQKKHVKTQNRLRVLGFSNVILLV